jgi:hypothetical protein
MRRVWILVLAVMLVGIVPQAAGAAGDVTGIVVRPNGVPLHDVDLALGGVTYTTSEDGRFVFRGAAPGELTVNRVAYADQTVLWDGAADWITITMVPMVVRSIHVAGWVPADSGQFQDMLDIGATTSVNALMIDTKNENGKVYPRLDVPTVSAIGAQAAESFDLAARVQQAHAQGFYVISRIVAFQDPIAAAAHPSWAARDRTTGGPLNNNGQVFLDPTDDGARRYALDLAVAVCGEGVDEVQFDYVRFPDGGAERAIFDGPADAEGRVEAITSFLREARSALEPLGCATAADIFGWITNTTTDGGIGQQLEEVSSVVDVVSPMIYPSHYSTGWYGFAVPNDHPAEVVTAASRDALRRMSASQAVLRPWLQDFWYTASQVRAQITSVDALGLGWNLWNIRSIFTVTGIPSTSSLTATSTSPPARFSMRPSTGFFDVPDGSTFDIDVAWMSAAGITTGCNPPWNDWYCPKLSVTRAQMAAFLVRALGLTDRGSATFSDTVGTTFEADIAKLATAGITRGCTPTRFCPDEVVTRAQMAAFLVRALNLTDRGSSSFSDTTGSVFEADIARLATAGITRGCTPTRFCPGDPVTRQQMAAFLHRALID